MAIIFSNIVLIVYALTSSLGLILLKLGSKAGAPISFVDNKIHFNIGLYVAGGIALYGVSFLIYTYLIAKNDLGYVVPVSTALVYTFIFIASFLIFKEVFSPLKIVGVGVILLGVILLNINK